MATPASVEREQYCSPTFRHGLYLRLIRSVFKEDNSQLKTVLDDIDLYDSEEQARRDREMERATEEGILSQLPTPILGRLHIEEKQSKLPNLLHEELVCTARPFPQDLFQDADDAFKARVLGVMLDVLHFLDVRAEVDQKPTLDEKVRAATKDYQGTPLHYAAGSSAADKVLLLLEKRADMNAKDSNDRNPIQMCPSHASVLNQATLDCFYKASYVKDCPGGETTVRVGNL
ncbi:uncharacterized protein [Littorina saxatilis]|uniref:uncharacterized protein n=1 Tax=Littorina saxatilis TaxID=31220 RepID=UPI0038B569D0